MMKNIFYIVALLLSLSSCEDFFEPKLSNEYTLEQIIEKEPGKMMDLVARAYRSFSAYPDSYNSNFLDCATDNAVTNQQSSKLNSMVSNAGYWSAQGGYNPLEQWAARYDDIKHINMFLTYGRDPEIIYSKSDPVRNELARERVTAEAYFLRGWSQFLLLRHNAGPVNGQMMGFPIVKTILNVDDIQQLSRNTFDECVDQIISDIDSALIVGLPDKWETQPLYNDVMGDENIGRPTSITCMALKARVLLYAASPLFSGDKSDAERKAIYVKAAKAASDAMEITGTSLPDVYLVDKNDPSVISEAFFNNPDNDELIMRRLDGGRNGGSTGLASRNFPPATLLIGGGRCNPSQNLVDAFPMSNGYPIDHVNNMGYDDETMYTDRDPRFYMSVLYNGSKISSVHNVTVETFDGGNCMLGAANVREDNTTRTGYFLRKWLGSSTNLVNETGSYHYNPLFRKAELFLNYAEACYYAYGWEGAGPAGISAKDAIVELRRRAGLSSTAYVDELSETQAEDLIKNERRIELCFEGHRFWDLRRWKDDINTPVYGVQIVQDGWTVEYKRRVILNPVYEDHMYYLPIPNNEILKTENIRQNDRWN